jgi:hypothetical protein
VTCEIPTAHAQKDFCKSVPASAYETKQLRKIFLSLFLCGDLQNGRLSVRVGGQVRGQNSRVKMERDWFV